MPLRPSAGDVLSGGELAALLSRLRGYPLAYSSPPRMMLRLFAPEYAKQIDLTDSKARSSCFRASSSDPADWPGAYKTCE